MGRYGMDMEELTSLRNEPSYLLYGGPWLSGRAFLLQAFARDRTNSIYSLDLIDVPGCRSLLHYRIYGKARQSDSVIASQQSQRRQVCSRITVLRKHLVEIEGNR